MEKYGSDHKLVLFSGDLLSPSSLSLHFEGHQFVEVFDRLNVRVSCLGNHDVFDFGEENLKKFINKSKPPGEPTKKFNNWLMANFYVKNDDTEERPIADLPATFILPYKGRKIGFMGLCD